jgi:deoxyribodipyrimidine photolyase-like uncharacterized protein
MITLRLALGDQLGRDVSALQGRDRADDVVLVVEVHAAAIGNAFFALTGVCLRRLPMTPEQVKAALSA